MKTSAVPYPGIRNPLVVYLMSCIQRVSPFYRMTRASSTWPLHFCHHSFETFCLAVLTSFLKRVFWMILFSAGAIFTSRTSKSGIRIPLTDNEDFKSSTESTISTSLIHSIASVGNCEQIHTSVLNPIFQQADVAGVGNLSK